MQPLHFVGLGVCLDGAVKVDVVALGDGHGFDVLPKAQLNFGRIWNKNSSQLLTN